MRRLVDSGHEWLGEIPGEWRLVPLGRLFRERRESTTAEDEQPLSVTKQGVVEQLDDVALSTVGAPKKLVEPNDIVINSRSDRKGSAGKAPRRGSVSVINTVLEPQQIDSGFAHYLIRSYPFQEEFYRFGTGIVADLWSTRWSEMKNITLPLPPLEEQRRIADYLDHETTQIDNFIKDQERLTSLLLERSYAALVQRVVGSDSVARRSEENMVPWAPGVFTPYQFTNIRRVAAMRTGHTPSRQRADYWLNTEIPWFTLADVWQLRAGRKYLGDTSEKISKVGLENSAADLLPEGTVVLSRTASVGFTGIMPRPMATSQDFWNWVCGPDLLPEYLWYQFRAMKPEFERIKSGSTHKTIYQADAAGMRIVVPPLAVQETIVGELKAEDQELQAMVEDSAKTIGLLKERRSALISAAVTGQLNVSSAGVGVWV